jgi:cytochrome P450
LNFFTPEILENPYPFFATWRAEQPLWRDEATGAWILTRHDDVRAVLKDSEAFSSKAMGGGDAGPLPLLADDPPRHTQLRGIVNKAFTTRMLKAIEGDVSRIAGALVADIADGESIDIVKALTTPLPVAVIAQMMGIPVERGADFKRWSDALTGTLASASLADREVEVGQMHAYFLSLIPERRGLDGADLVSAVVNAEFEGERLADSEAVGFCMLLLIAGNETTTNLLGNLLNVLADRPDLVEALIHQPELIDQAIEEILRFDGPVQFLRRRLTRDATFHGQTLKAGELVHVIMASANRDGAVYAQPDEFLLTREKSHHHTFGFGIHFCIGAPLARLEARIALRHLFARFAKLSRGDGLNERVPSHLLRGFHHLSLKFSAQ